MIRFPIETERLLLRPFTLDDAGELHAASGDPASLRFGGDWPRPETVEDTQRYLDRVVAGQQARGFALWAVIEKATSELVGDCGLFPADGVGPEVELAYGLRRDRWERGYATEAASACVRVGFDELGLERIVADVDPGNARSIRVLEKLGFELEREEGGKRFYALEKPRASRSE